MKATTMWPLLTSAVLALIAPRASSQDHQLQERLAALKQASAANQQALAEYTWQELQTVTIKGDVKKTEAFRVRYLPDGTQEKTPVDPDTTAASGGRKHGIKHRIVVKKTKEYENYGKKLAALAHLYAHPDPAKLQAAYQAGKVAVGPSGNPDESRLVIRDYAKPGDSATISFDRIQKTVTNVQVQSYLNDPNDKAEITVKFARIPDGPYYPKYIGIDGVSKQLAVGIVNSNYRKISEE